MSFIPMRTRGFTSNTPPNIQANIITYALRKIKPEKPNRAAFYPDSEKKEHPEDNGRTLTTTMKGSTKKSTPHSTTSEARKP